MKRTRGPRPSSRDKESPPLHRRSMDGCIRRQRRQSSSSNKETQQDPSRRRPGEHATAVVHVGRGGIDAAAVAQKTRKRTLGPKRRGRRRSRRPRRDRCSRCCTQKRTIKRNHLAQRGALALFLDIVLFLSEVGRSKRKVESLDFEFGCYLATHRCQSDFRS